MNPGGNPASLFGDYNQFSSSDDVPVDKAFYYPSTNKVLEDEEKKTALTQRYVDPPNSDSTYFGEDKKGTPNSMDNLLSFVDLSGTLKYNESWATTTEKSFPMPPIPIQTRTETSSAKETPPSKEHSIEDYIEKNGGYRKNGGTLSKFVQRFREEPPLARGERQKEAKNKDFWWLHSPKEIKSSTPNSTDSSYPSLDLESISLSPATTDQAANVPGKKPQIEPRLLYGDDTDSGISRMQLRTEKLLQLSENAVHETASSSNVSQNPYAKKMENLRPKYSVEKDPALSLTTASNKPVNENLVEFQKARKSLKPEDDILYQWRLSRKMELAAESVEKNPFLEPRATVTNKEDVAPKKTENYDKVQQDKTERYKVPQDKTEKYDKVPKDKTEKYDKVPQDKKPSKKEVKEKSSSKRLKNSDTHDSSSAETKDSSSSEDGSESKSTTSESDENSVGEKKSLKPKVRKKLNEGHEQIKNQTNCNCKNQQQQQQQQQPNQQQQCRCYTSQPQRCHCNARTVCHIPSYVHVYDFSSCIQNSKQGDANCKCRHKESSSYDDVKSKNEIFATQPRSAEKYKSRISQNGVKPFDDRDISEKRRVPEDHHGGINPVINQVISDHLFTDSIENSFDATRETKQEKRETGKRNVDLYTVDLITPLFDDDFSSGDEFPDDEILHELRTRRRNIKIEQRMVSERLKQLKT